MESFIDFQSSIQVKITTFKENNQCFQLARRYSIDLLDWKILTGKIRSKGEVASFNEKKTNRLYYVTFIESLKEHCKIVK